RGPGAAGRAGAARIGGTESAQGHAADTWRARATAGDQNSAARDQAAAPARALGRLAGRRQSRLVLREAQHRVTDLLTQHEPGDGRHAQENVAELQPAGRAAADHLALAQQVDEILEQRSIEELGGVETVEHRDALRVQLAALL